MPDYRVALLHKLGMPVTKANLRFLQAWQAQEGGATHNSATFNWFNTTHGSQFPSINSVGVRAFPNFQTGINYTADTLRSGRYNDILAGLQSGNPYSTNVTGGLETWVSGSPTGNPGYASRVLGKGVAPSKALSKSVSQGRVASPTRAIAGASPDIARQALLAYFMDSNSALMAGGTPPDFAPYAQFAQIAAQSSAPSVLQRTPQKATGRVLSSTKASNGFLQAPEHWKGTHVTDGLGWGTKTAEDIMAPAGTAVGAPEAGTVLYFHPNGAQGGGSMEFRSDSGKLYWMGHLDNGVPKGHVNRGDVIAYISSRHPRPHLHIDER